MCVDVGEECSGHGVHPSPPGDTGYVCMITGVAPVAFGVGRFDGCRILAVFSLLGASEVRLRVRSMVDHVADSGQAGRERGNVGSRTFYLSPHSQVPGPVESTAAMS